MDIRLILILILINPTQEKLLTCISFQIFNQFLPSCIPIVCACLNVCVCVCVCLPRLFVIWIAYADMSLHLDRYLRVGGLYTYYDNTIDNEPLFKDYNDALVYADPIKDPAEVRDLIVLCKGPDKGRTGIVIGMYPSDGSYSPSGSGSKRKIGTGGGGGGGKSSKPAADAASGVSTCVVKLERYRGMREIRVVPRSWAAKRLGEQDPDDVFLIPRSQQQQSHSKKTQAMTTGSSSRGSILS